jgi:NAD(P)-dependent dehydrogenase (short-subunit alcohol dehydrogenase family)
MITRKMKRLQNQVAIITGAASGLGRAIVLLYASEGARVVAADINEEGLSVLKEKVTGKNGTVTTVIADMARKVDIENMVKVALDTYGTVDILVNNAGIMDNFYPAAEVTDQLWERVMAINVTGPFKAMRSVLSIMLEKKIRGHH